MEPVKNFDFNCENKKEKNWRDLSRGVPRWGVFSRTTLPALLRLTCPGRSRKQETSEKADTRLNTINYDFPSRMGAVQAGNVVGCCIFGNKICK